MAERFELEPVVELLSRPKIAFTCALAILGDFVWQATSSFLPTFLVAHRGQSATTASLVFGGYFVVQGITQVGVGAVSDRYGRDMTTAACMVLSVAGFALFVAVLGPSPLRPASCFSGSASAGVRRCCPASWTTSRRPNAARGSVSCGPSTASSARWARSSPEPWQICSVGGLLRIPRGVADHRLRRALAVNWAFSLGY